MAAIAAALVGLINVASTLTPNIRWRGHLLLEYEPVEAVHLFHAFALPAGAALLLVSPYLLRRRHRAWQTAVALMVILGGLDLLKGLDFEEALITWAVAGALIWARPAFSVHHEPLTQRSAIWRVPLLGSAAVALAAITAWATEGHPSWTSVARETGDLLMWRPGPIHFHHHAVYLHHRITWVPLGVHLVEIGTLLAMAYVVFRPLAAPSRLPGPALRSAAADLVRAHGSDTLSFFKLRTDKHYFFSADERAFVGYRIENGVLLLSGDPVGPADSPAPAAGRAQGLRRDPRPQARRRRRQRGAVPAVRGARAAHHLPGRRGDPRAQPVLPGGTGDSQGPPVGQPAAQGRLHHRAARGRRAGRRHRARRRAGTGARA